MLKKALDLLRILGWSVMDFIYSLIDSLFDILKEINALDIVNSVSNESMFTKFYTGIMAIAIAVLGLFAVYNFVKKVIDPDIEITAQQIIKDIIKCGALIIMSTFLFVQSSNLSIKLSGYTASIFTVNGNSIGDNMLTQYVTYTDAYKVSDEFKNENIGTYISNNTFTNKKMYNDKFVTNAKWILPDEKEYKYSINWIMGIIVGGFFLYALFFSGMMLARRQIEFLFLFVISPILFATSVGNKQRRGALYEQLVSLILQGAVVMLIIGLTAILMKSIQGTTFFANSAFKDVVIKSILYIGCGTFLLTGSQVVNKFIGSNISASSAREQMMSMMGFSNGIKTGAVATGLGAMGVSKFGTGVASSIVGRVGGNKLVDNIGKAVTNYGNKISDGRKESSPISKIGNTISKFGTGISSKTPSNIGKSLRTSGINNVSDAISTMSPTRNMYRRRYNGSRRI
ncbi:MAG TPA: hypothetical protein GX708_09740 [Gallicola sp.]|nr:hypothetical protein [Gallicola sp.]